VDPILKTIFQRIEGDSVKERGMIEASSLLSESLGLGKREIISLVGAGGKTSLMFRLARELVLGGKQVVTTTTTRILEPFAEESPCLFVDSENEKIRRFLKEYLSSYRHITVAQERLGAGKLKGISSGFAQDLSRLEEIDYLIVEADGAAGHPIKAPKEGEPVIPFSTTLTVALSGVDGLGLELREENVFRSERVSRLTGLSQGNRMTEEAMAVLITHADGIFKGAPDLSRIVVFLNKVDTLNGLEKGERIAGKILDQRHRRIERIILGQLKTEPPVVKVFFSRHSDRPGGS
jgi:probable selenium-dependent hydroxylase accessory protein YqeC